MGNLVDSLRSNDKSAISPIRLIFDKFSRNKDASFVYGEPISLENKKVLPVAKLEYYVGGGGGYSVTDEKESVGHGEGGGGRFSVNPVGVYEITSEKVQFKPVIHLQFILTLIFVFTFGLIVLLKKSSKKIR